MCPSQRAERQSSPAATTYQPELLHKGHSEIPTQRTPTSQSCHILSASEGRSETPVQQTLSSQISCRSLRLSASPFHSETPVQLTDRLQHKVTMKLLVSEHRPATVLAEHSTWWLQMVVVRCVHNSKRQLVSCRKSPDLPTIEHRFKDADVIAEKSSNRQRRF